jgi:hypothetical protein
MRCVLHQQQFGKEDSEELMKLAQFKLKEKTRELIDIEESKKNKSSKSIKLVVMYTPHTYLTFENSICSSSIFAMYLNYY